MHALVAGGADVIEVGVPFSDPEAEGPAIQRSSERALAAGTRLVDISTSSESSGLKTR
jgi:tryptophan synthase alpha chain